MKNKKLYMALLCFVFLLTLYSNSVQAKPTQAEWLFSVHMIAPNNNPARALYSQLMEDELRNIGINAELDLINWPALLQRAALRQVGTYDEGGYDIAFFGMSLGSPAAHVGDNMLGIYHSSGVPPNGFNAMYFSPDRPGDWLDYRAAENDEMIEDITTELNETKAKEIFVDWQKLYFDALPNIMVYNLMEIHPISTGLYGYDPPLGQLQSIEDMWFTDDFIKSGTNKNDTLILAASAGPLNFISTIINDVYSQYTVSPINDALLGQAPSLEVVLPAGTDWETWMQANYGVDEPFAFIPRVASGLHTASADGLQINISLRDDAYWHDGHKVDAWDLAFTYQAIMTPGVRSDEYGSLVIAFGEDDKAAGKGNYSFIVEDANSDGHDEKLIINFDTTYAPFPANFLTYTIHPEHILGDPVSHGFNGAGDFDPLNTWRVPPGSWDTHSINTGNPADRGGYKGPIGCGSMVFYEMDQTTRWVTLKKFEDIMWDNSTSDWVATPGMSHYLIKEGKLGSMVDTAKAIVATTVDSAIADMKVGDIHVIDEQFSMASIFDELQAEALINALQTPATGWQAIYPNPQVPDLYKKGVRHAISHVVPREDIIEHIFDGLGYIAFTPIPPQSWAVIPQDEMVAYKRTVAASNGSLLLTGETTAYDSYDPELALDWLETEGYDVDPWREGAEPTEPGAGAPGFELLVALSAITLPVVTLHKRRRK
ncbi:MAG: ABC transporter substrate-binding protein [Candidatus Hermodarchaeota archaeon]